MGREECQDFAIINAPICNSIKSKSQHAACTNLCSVPYTSKRSELRTMLDHALVWSKPSSKCLSRRSVSQVAKETFPNWVSQSVQTALNPKTVRPNPQTPRPRPDRPKVGADVEFGTLPRIPSGSYPRSQFYFPFKILERTSKKLRSQAQTAQKCQAILWDLGDSRTRRFQSQKS